MSSYKENEFLMLSGIQHFMFCRRQWALIHIEQQWSENERTVEGELLHKRAHEPVLLEKRKDVIISRALPIRSFELGISGICDIVEFHKVEEGVKLFGHKGNYDVYPIEYKKGRPKVNEVDTVQLVAQAMCLEEMLSTTIDEGAIYYAETRHREKIGVTKELRDQVINLFEEMHQLYEKKYTPKVKWSKSCNACSLKNICIPKLGKINNVEEYVNKMINGESI